MFEPFRHFTGKGGDMLDLIRNPTLWTTTVLLAPLAVHLDPQDLEGLQTRKNRSGESSTATVTVGGGYGSHGTGVELLLGGRLRLCRAVGDDTGDQNHARFRRGLRRLRW
jgi:hypothetical protein